MREALISVIMPVYNAEKRLEMSINSVLNQTYQQLELILIDDGSTDSSAMICDLYARADKRVMVVHQENARVSAARNRGIQLATGEYLSFIDADDTIDPETYAVVMKQFTDRSIDMVIYGMQFDYYKNQKLQKRHIKSIEKNYCFNVKNINAHFSYLSDQNYFLSSCNKVIKSTIIKDNQIVFEKEMSILEDFKFVLDVLEKSKKVCVLDGAWYHYYHDLNASQLKRRPAIDYIRNFQILDKRLREFSQKFEMDKGSEREKINGMILRYYIIAIEKRFTSNDRLKEKYIKMKEIITLNEFQTALKNAAVSGKRLIIVVHLLKKKSFIILFWLFLANGYLGKMFR